MFDGLLIDTQPAPVRDFSSIGKMSAEYIGPARQGCNDIGNLYRASNGITYFVPNVRCGHMSLPVVADAEEVISNPSGYYNDMLFISVSPHLMARGLRTALETACRAFMMRNGDEWAQCG